MNARDAMLMNGAGLSESFQSIVFDPAMFARVLDIARTSAEAAATELSHLGLELSLETMRAHLSEAGHALPGSPI
jgi:hypothetical protein